MLILLCYLSDCAAAVCSALADFIVSPHAGLTYIYSESKGQNVGTKKPFFHNYKKVLDNKAFFFFGIICGMQQNQEIIKKLNFGPTLAQFDSLYIIEKGRLS